MEEKYYYHDLTANDDPYICMVIEPETKYRFRYASEGGSHGGLAGRERIKGKKTYPTVKRIDINREDFEGKTPLLIAHIKGNYNVVKQLLSAGATYKKINSKYIRDDKLASLREMEASVRQASARQASARQASVRQASARQASARQASARQASVRQAYFNEAYKGPPDFNRCNEDKESAKIFEELAENLSALLDPDMKWKELATYVLDEKYLSSLEECSQSPTRAILEYMKKTLGAQYIEHLMAVLNLMGFSDAVIATMAYVMP